MFAAVATAAVSVRSRPVSVLLTSPLSSSSSSSSSPPAAANVTLSASLHLLVPRLAPVHKVLFVVACVCNFVTISEKLFVCWQHFGETITAAIVVKLSGYMDNSFGGLAVKITRWQHPAMDVGDV